MATAETAVATRYPMWTMQLEHFMALDSMYAHQFLLREGILRRWQPGMRVIFFSHQWRHSTHPDPDGAQLRTAQHQLRRLKSGAVKQVAPNWIQALAFPDDDTPTLSAAYWSTLLSDENTHVWIDYHSIYQPRVMDAEAQVASLRALDLGTRFRGRRKSTLDVIGDMEKEWQAQSEQVTEGDGWKGGLQTLKDAVSSIPAYLERSELVMVIAPPLAHLERTCEICDTRNWLQRGWCTLGESAITAMEPRVPCSLLEAEAR